MAKMSICWYISHSYLSVQSAGRSGDPLFTCRNPGICQNFLFVSLYNVQYFITSSKTETHLLVPVILSSLGEFTQCELHFVENSWHSSLHWKAKNCFASDICHITKAALIVSCYPLGESDSSVHSIIWMCDLLSNKRQLVLLAQLPLLLGSLFYTVSLPSQSNGKSGALSLHSAVWNRH